jgi:carboxypeptidase C (cathepsin A)
LIRFSLAAALISTASVAWAADKPDPASAQALHKKSVAEAVKAGWATAPVEETEVTTRHSIKVHGRKLAYKATAGTLTIRDKTGKPDGSIFYVAYTLDGGEKDSKRPVTFFYNGGPGSASLWLHVGSFGPMRVQTGSPETIKPAPYKFGPNPDTLLDKTDLVFIDMMGAGYSRPLGDAKGTDFWGVDQDVDTFARAIMRYTTKFSRWNNPKFLFGESYGTLRSGALAYQLQDRGMALNGVVLLSSVLNYGIDQTGYDFTYIYMLPSYAATAWYHHRIPNPPADVDTIVQQAREFAVGPYAAALAKGQAISAAEFDSIAQRLSELTGLSVDVLKRAKLRVDLGLFRKELLRDKRLTIGRLDARYTGYDAQTTGTRPDFDFSSTAISGAFVSTLRDYLREELDYKTDMSYRVSAREVEDFKWDWQHRAPGTRWPQSTPNTAIDLSAAMRMNPYLQVLSLNGYYDMATPFFATEYDMSHMLLEPEQQRNIEFRYYESGHMIYLNPGELHQLHADLDQFYDHAVNVALSTTPPVTPTIAATPENGGPGRSGL